MPQEAAKREEMRDATIQIPDAALRGIHEREG
jgi:hypothetical protein